MSPRINQYTYVINRLRHMPFSSADEIKKWPGTAVGQVEAYLNYFFQGGAVDREKIGWMRDAQWRWVLSEAMVEFLTNGQKSDREWQGHASGRDTIRSFGPMMECINDVVPQAWSPETVRVGATDPLDGWYPDEEDAEYLRGLVQDSYLLHFAWLREGPMNGLIELLDPDDAPFWVPVLWWGTHAPQKEWPDTLFGFFEQLPTKPDPDTGVPAAPPGIVIVAADALAATRAAREIPPSIPRAIITYGTDVANADGKKGRFGIADIQPMLNPRRPVGEVLMGSQQRLPPGSADAANVQDKGVRGPSTRPHYKAFSEIAARHGSRVSEVASALRTSNTHARRLINDLIQANRLGRAGNLLYVSERGVSYLAAHNGIAQKELKGALTVAPKPGELIPTVQEKRRKAINDLRTRFGQVGWEVFDGRRMGVGRPTDKRQWYPDLWVRIPAAQGKYVWNAVLVDPSMQADSMIRNVLREIRYATQREKENRALLVVCRDDAAAQLFDEIGDDLAMMVATYRNCLKGSFFGSDSIWRFKGRVEDIDFLSREMAPN